MAGLEFCSCFSKCRGSNFPTGVIYQWRGMFLVFLVFLDVVSLLASWLLEVSASGWCVLLLVAF